MTRKPKEDVKQKILATAEKLFARQGFDATGIDQIAKTADITKSLIYYYFKSKDDILSELFQIFVTKSIKLKLQISDMTWASDSEHDVENILKNNILPFLISQKDFIKIAFTESVKETTSSPHINIFQYINQNFRASFEHAKEHGVELDEDKTNIASFFLFWTPLLSFVIFHDEWSDYYKIDLKRITDLFISAYLSMYKSLVGFKPERSSQTDLSNILKQKK